MADKRQRMALPATGGSSLLVIFAVLALTVFALLSLSTALAEKRLSDAAAGAAAAYYAADARAEELFALLRRGEEPEGVREENGRYVYTCPVSETQCLQVELEKNNETWRVLRWETVSVAEAAESGTLRLWDGETME